MESSPLPLGMLSVEDLIRRPSLTQAEQWNEDGNEKKKPIIALERFQELEQHLRNSPADAKAYLELAEIYSSQHRYVDAKRVLERAVEVLPDDMQLRYHWEEAAVARARQMLDQSEKLLAEESNAANQQHHDRCIVELANLRISICNARMKRDPEQTELLLPLAASLRQLGRHEEAIQALQKAVNIPDLRSRAALQLGMALQQIGKSLDALAAYRRAALFRSPPPNEKVKDRALELAADLAEQLGLIDSARRYLSLRLEMHPHDTILKQRLKQLHARSL